MTFAGVNYWAVLIAAVVAWIAGAAWYMSLGKAWQAAVGMTPEKMAAAKSNPYAWVPFVLVFLGHLVMGGRSPASWGISAPSTPRTASSPARCAGSASSSP